MKKIKVYDFWKYTGLQIIIDCDPLKIEIKNYYDEDPELIASAAFQLIAYILNEIEVTDVIRKIIIVPGKIVNFVI